MLELARFVGTYLPREVTCQVAFHVNARAFYDITDQQGALRSLPSPHQIFEAQDPARRNLLENLSAAIYWKISDGSLFFPQASH